LVTILFLIFFFNPDLIVQHEKGICIDEPYNAKEKVLLEASLLIGAASTSFASGKLERVSKLQTFNHLESTVLRHTSSLHNIVKSLDKKLSKFIGLGV